MAGGRVIATGKAFTTAMSKDSYLLIIHGLDGLDKIDKLDEAAT